jgi:heat shock protein HslJ
LPPTVELRDGRWTGEPFQPGGASRPSVTLLPGFQVRGDLGGDGRDDVVAVLATSSGGSGEFVHVVVLAGGGSRWAQSGLAPLGDRVQVRAGRITGGVLLLDVVEGGPGDAACCPGRVVTRGWRVAADGDIEEFETGLPEARLSWSLLSGSSWALRSWGRDAPVADSAVITLEAEAGLVAGHGGCNRYRAGVEDGTAPGEIAIGELAVTRMACPEPQMADERRYLEQLRRTSKIGFFGGRLALSYQDGERGWDRMLFESLTEPAADQ